MSAEQIVINILIGMLGLAVGYAVTSQKAVRQLDRQVGEQGRDIKTAFRDIDAVNRRQSEMMAQQSETISLIGKLVEQNTFLIQRDLAERR